ncbi:MAG TPA: peptide chain release factor-like protein [Polyangia bacterium]
MALPLHSDRARAVAARLEALGIREEDLEESFIHAGGKGGQNVNKVATCVVLIHRPSGTAVKCQRERTQGQNRLVARALLAEKIETARAGRASARAQEAARIQRQKRRRSRRAKQKMLADKHARAETKVLRRKIDRVD